MIIFKEFSYDDFHENVKQIYEKEEWSAYLGNDLKLKRAFDNSLYKLEYKCILIQPILGIEITRQGSINDCQELLYPVDVHFKIIPNRYINIIPNQKEGIEINMLKIDSPIFLILLLLVLCKKKDRGIDTKKTINIEIKAILSVKGSLSKISLKTGSLYLKEIPKSP